MQLLFIGPVSRGRHLGRLHFFYATRLAWFMSRLENFISDSLEESSSFGDLTVEY